MTTPKPLAPHIKLVHSVLRGISAMCAIVPLPSTQSVAVLGCVLFGNAKRAQRLLAKPNTAKYPSKIASLIVTEALNNMLMDANEEKHVVRPTGTVAHDIWSALCTSSCRDRRSSAYECVKMSRALSKLSKWGHQHQQLWEQWMMLSECPQDAIPHVALHVFEQHSEMVPPTTILTTFLQHYGHRLRGDQEVCPSVSLSKHERALFSRSRSSARSLLSVALQWAPEKVCVQLIEDMSVVTSADCQNLHQRTQPTSLALLHTLDNKHAIGSDPLQDMQHALRKMHSTKNTDLMDFLQDNPVMHAAAQEYIQWQQATATRATLHESVENIAEPPATSMAPEPTRRAKM